MKRTKKKVLGFGYRIASESLEHTIEEYYAIQGLTLHKTAKEVKEVIKFDIENGIVVSNCKFKIFKVTAEEI
jgi:hypothetical protein